MSWSAYSASYFWIISPLSVSDSIESSPKKIMAIQYGLKLTFSRYKLTLQRSDVACCCVLRIENVLQYCTIDSVRSLTRDSKNLPSNIKTSGHAICPLGGFGLLYLSELWLLRFGISVVGTPQHKRGPPKRRLPNTPIQFKSPIYLHQTFNPLRSQESCPIKKGVARLEYVSRVCLRSDYLMIFRRVPISLRPCIGRYHDQDQVVQPFSGDNTTCVRQRRFLNHLHIFWVSFLDIYNWIYEIKPDSTLYKATVPMEIAQHEYLILFLSQLQMVRCWSNLPVCHAFYSRIVRRSERCNVLDLPLL